MTTPTEDPRAGLPSASSMDRLNKCPGSFAAEKGLPELKQQDVTESGTKIHAALAGGDEELELSDKEIKERMKSIEKAVVATWCEEFGLPTVVPDFREERMWIHNRTTLEPVSSAQPDVAYVDKTHALLINYKAGYADLTPSELNWQCRTEALALWHEYPQLTHIRGAILASRLYDKFDATDYDLADLQRIERELFHILWRADQSDAPRVPGAWCRYCRASGSCPEAAVFAMINNARVPVKAGSLEVAESVGRMTPKQLAYVHRRSALANAIFDAVEQRLKALPPTELEAVGYRMADGNRKISFTNVTEAMARLLNVMTPEQRAECITISLPTASKIVAEKESITVKAARAKVEVTLGDSFNESKGNPRLRPI